jgi:hypothetical protein
LVDCNVGIASFDRCPSVPRASADRSIRNWQAEPS